MLEAVADVLAGTVVHGGVLSELFAELEIDMALVGL